MESEGSSSQVAIWRRGVGPWVSQFERHPLPEYASINERSDVTYPSKHPRNSQGLVIRFKHKNKRKKLRRRNITNSKSKFDPNADDKIKSEPLNTVFIARLEFNTTEETLSDVFRRYGTIRSLRLVRDTETGKSRGYAFVEFSDQEEAKRVLRETRDESLVIDGRKILVDRVRAGVVSSWLPRRLGGGLGHRQRGTQRFTYKIPYFGDASRIDHADIQRKQQLWMEHNRCSMKI